MEQKKSPIRLWGTKSLVNLSPIKTPDSPSGSKSSLTSKIIRNSPKKKTLDQLSGVESCISARLVRDTIVSKKSNQEKIDFISGFVDDLETKLESKKTNGEKTKLLLKEVFNWLELADKKCSKQLVKQGFKTEKEQKEYIDIQMIYETEKRSSPIHKSYTKLTN